jgi:hypothetical protein
LKWKASSFRNLFFLEIAERPTEAPAISKKKRFLNENLQRKAGIGSLISLFLKKGRKQMKHLLNLFV